MGIAAGFSGTQSRLVVSMFALPNVLVSFNAESEPEFPEFWVMIIETKNVVQSA